MSYRFWSFGPEQTQKLKQKVDQKQIKLQDQNNSNRLLVLLLSSAENLASKMNLNLKREYISHDFGHSYESKSLNKILLQFIEQIEIFESSYIRYCKTHKCQYDFPYDSTKKNGLSKEEIINDLNKWKNIVRKEYKKYYQAVIDIFYNKRIPDFTEDIENIPDIDDFGKEDRCNPKELRDVYPVLLEQMYSEKKKISNDYSNNKGLKIVINKRENNSNYEYEQKINEKLMKNKMNTMNPNVAKKSIKFKPIRKFDEDYINLPEIIIEKLKNICVVEESHYQTLNNWLNYYKNNSLYNILYDFLVLIKVNKLDIGKVIDYICDELYNELVFDNK